MCSSVSSSVVLGTPSIEETLDGFYWFRRKHAFLEFRPWSLVGQFYLVKFCNRTCPVLPAGLDRS